jgi:hypothetical protein
MERPQRSIENSRERESIESKEMNPLAFMLEWMQNDRVIHRPIDASRGGSLVVSIESKALVIPDAMQGKEN